MTSLSMGTGVDELNPVWTPDGRNVVFGVLGKNRGLFRAPADGSGRAEQLVPGDGLLVPDSWTSDGKMLLYTSGAGAASLTIGSTGVVKPYALVGSSILDRDAQISPDGKWVAYTSDESGRHEIYAQAFPGPGGRIAISRGEGQEPRWSGDGRELFYRNARTHQMVQVDFQTGSSLQAGPPKPLFELRSPYWDVTPDGKQFLVVKQEESSDAPTKVQVVVNWFEELRQKSR